MLQNKNESRRFHDFLQRENQAFSSSCDQLRTQQAALYTRYLDLCGSKLYQTKLEKLDEQLKQIHLKERVLQAPSLLGKPSEVRLPETINAEHNCCPHTTLHTEPAQGTGKKISDLGKPNAFGDLQIDKEFSRPFYPWETKAGMSWIKSLGSSIGNHHTSTKKTLLLHNRLQGQADSPTIETLSAAPITPDVITEELAEHQIKVRIVTPKCPPDSVTLLESMLSDIPSLLTSYHRHHQILQTKNQLLNSKKAILARLDPDTAKEPLNAIIVKAKFRAA